MSTWTTTEAATVGSSLTLVELFGPKGQPQEHWNTQDPIVAPKEEGHRLKTLVVKLPSDRYGDVEDHTLTIEADGPDHDINRMDLLYQRIKQLYNTKADQEFVDKYHKLFKKDKNQHPLPQLGQPWLYGRMEGLLEEGLEVIDEECTATHCVLKLGAM